MTFHIINDCPVNYASSVIVNLEIVEPTRWAGLALPVTAMKKYEENSLIVESMQIKAAHLW
jgi:hypothetical protein